MRICWYNNKHKLIKMHCKNLKIYNINYNNNNNNNKGKLTTSALCWIFVNHRLMHGKYGKH
jgi:hypothetical protein